MRFRRVPGQMADEAPKGEPAPKRRKPEKVCALVGGEVGPDPTTHLVDCGWRCAALVLACHNSGWTANLAKLAEKHEMLGQALRGQSTNYLLHSFTEWQTHWRQDERANETTELEQSQLALPSSRRLWSGLVVRFADWDGKLLAFAFLRNEMSG